MVMCWPRSAEERRSDGLEKMARSSMRSPERSCVCSVTIACKAKLLMKEMRSERLSRLSASTLVNEAIRASTRQSMRMVECVDASPSPTAWPGQGWG